MKSPLVVSFLAMLLLASIFSACPAAAASPADLRSKMEKREFKNGQGQTLLYRLFVPRQYDAAKKYPVILFLHGAGERDNDNEAQLKWAEVLNLVSEKNAAKHPAFLVAPQCPTNDTWAGLRLDRSKPFQAADESTRTMHLTLEMLDSLEKEFSIDATRRYVTGLSMGGFGSFDLCVRRPKAIAAAVPICGGGDPSKAETLRDIAFWVFHGGADGVVHPDFSRKMVKALEEAKAKVKYTEYPGVGHNSWSQAYQEPELAEWLFSQHR